MEKNDKEIIDLLSTAHIKSYLLANGNELALDYFCEQEKSRVKFILASSFQKYGNTTLLDYYFDKIV